MTVVAWEHTLHMEGGQTYRRFTTTFDDPFGERSPEYVVVSEPLCYANPANVRRKTRAEAQLQVRRNMAASS